MVLASSARLRLRPRLLYLDRLAIDKRTSGCDNINNDIMAAPIDSASSASSSAGSASSNSSSIDPLTRNALRYSLSPREYKLLHKYLISRAPPPVKKRVPHPYKYEKSVEKTGDYNAAAVRASLRVFGVALAGLKGWDLITEKVLRRAKEAVYVG